jgi:thiamine pyrophosphate-dependent acetolactate synthase large subunit-like protein
MKVAEAVGTALARLGVRRVFGVVGSGNFHLTNALVAAGAPYVAARHEGGAATMADAYARVSGELAAVSLHQGCGLTNALTGITEAAKSRTPLLILSAEATAAASNFFIDQPALAGAVGAISIRIDSAEDCLDQALAAVVIAVHERRTVLVNLPLDVQATPVPEAVVERLRTLVVPPPPAAVEPDPADIATLTDLLATAQRPVLLAGRGARGARAEMLALAEATGALLATSAVAKGLFTGSPWSLDVSGGFASPLAARLIADADLLVAFGCALNMWTTRHGSLIGAQTRLVQVDHEPAAIGLHRPVQHGIVGDSARTAAAVTAALEPGPRAGYRSAALATRIAAENHWQSVPYDDWGTEGEDPRIDPRTLTIGLDELLPAERLVAVDSGNFMGYPSMFLAVPDADGFCFTQSFQSIGLGLATAMGRAGPPGPAHPGRPRRRRRADGRSRTRHRAPARATDGGRGLQRQRVRGRGAPLHRRRTAGHGHLPGDRSGRHRHRLRLRRGHRSGSGRPVRGGDLVGRASLEAAAGGRQSGLAGWFLVAGRGFSRPLNSPMRFLISPTVALRHCRDVRSDTDRRIIFPIRSSKRPTHNLPGYPSLHLWTVGPDWSPLPFDDSQFSKQFGVSTGTMNQHTGT